MLIKRIIAKNYKTYLDLDLNIATASDQPIILIGGANGGGKTTFFDAIYGALYGLDITDKTHFKKLLNAGAIDEVDHQIKLEIHFSGRVLNKEQNYVLSRHYQLNSDSKIVEGVRLNMDGNIFSYGTATPAKQRAEQEAQVNKIIKANLPEELSQYFLFDAMQAGELLKEDYLNRVIKENIENAMGFDKYLKIGKAAEKLTEDFTAQRLELEEEKQEYRELTDSIEKLKKKIEHENTLLREATEFSIQNKKLYEDLKSGLNKESHIKQRIDELKKQIEQSEERAKDFKKQAKEFTDKTEQHICLPNLADAFKNEVSLVLKEKNKNEQQRKEEVSESLMKELLSKAIKYLSEKGYDLERVSTADIAQYILKDYPSEKQTSNYDFFTSKEIKALENLVNNDYYNPYPNLVQVKNEVSISLNNAQKNKSEIESLKNQITNKDYDFIEKFDDNEAKIKKLQKEVEQLTDELGKLQGRKSNYDIPSTEEPDPKFERLKKLKPLFDKIANTLLKNKKEQIEVRMKEDLNANLEAYQGVIKRVELSEDLQDLNFKLFHEAGNEIYLSELNTASTQVVVQVLLKSLHEFGDYDPPVMIDTVMGVLDKNSRSILLENYFPGLSHQTILLSSDSEIRPEADLEKIESFISKAFTLKRDKKEQRTEIKEGYFNREIKV